MADGSRFNSQHTYITVMSSHLAIVSKYEKSDEGRNLFRTTADLIIEYLKKQPTVDYKGIKRLTIK